MSSTCYRPRTRLVTPGVTRGILLFLTLVPCSRAQALGQEARWLPQRGTHAWARFRLGAWKEVQIRHSTFDEDEEVVRSSTSLVRTRITRLARRSFSLSISTTVNVAGQQLASEPQVITRNLTPEVLSSEVVGTDTVTVGDSEYPTQVIKLVTRKGTKRETSKIYYSSTTTPSILRRITTRVDSKAPDVQTSTTVNVTKLNQQTNVLGEVQCTWSVTTVIQKRDGVVTIREVHCPDVPGELVSQVMEQRDTEGKLISRKELELVGYGHGRRPLRFRRRR